jgi:hypothetical protein
MYYDKIVLILTSIFMDEVIIDEKHIYGILYVFIL